MGEPLPRSYSVSFHRLLAEEQGGPKVLTKTAIYDQAGWKAFFGGQPPHPMPGVNAERETLIAIGLGEKPSSGYSVEVLGVTREIGGIVGLMDTVTWREVPPKGAAADVMRYPYCVIVVPLVKSAPVFSP